MFSGFSEVKMSLKPRQNKEKLWKELNHYDRDITE